MGESKGKTILLVEDEAIIALGEREALREFGYDVVIAYSGEDAVKAARGRPAPVDLVLMDIDLGRGIDGPEAARRILAESEIPIVFLSSHTEPAIVERTESITSYGYVVKSSSWTVLDASIKMAFRLFEANRRTRSAMDKLSATLGALPDLLFELGLDGSYYECHYPRADLLYASPSELIGRRVEEVLPPEVAGTIMAALRETHETGSSVGRLYEAEVPAGRRWFEISATRLEGPTDQPHFIMLCRDVTERKRLEDRYLTSNEMLHKILDSIPQFICWKDRNSVFLGCNKNHSDLFGLPGTESIVGKTDWDLHRGKAEIEHFIEDDRLVMESDSPKYHILEEAHYPDGAARWLDTNKVPLHDAAGRVSGILIAYSDITERKRTEDSLAREQYLRQALMDKSSDFIFFKDPESRFILANRAIAAYFGLADPSEMLGRTDLDFFPEEYARRKLEEEAEIFRTGNSLSSEEEQAVLGGSPRWVLTEKWPLRDKDGAIIGTFGFSRDITGRKRAEEALADEQYLLKTLLDSTSDHIYFKDRESRFIRNSRAHVEFLGLRDASEMEGKTDFDFFAEAHARQAFEDEREVMRTGRSIRKEETNIRDGEPESWVLTEKMPLRDRAGNIVGTFGISREITELKRTEARIKGLLREKELILKEVHHRIKNNMDTICGLLTLQASAVAAPEAVAALEDAAGRVKSMLVLYEQLYLSTEFSEMSIRDYLPALVEKIAGIFPSRESVRIETELEDIRLQPRTLQPLGIIVNELITNIFKYAFAGRAGGRIGIAAREREGLVHVEITDDGNGIPEGVDFQNARGFGLMLVGMLTEQLKGRISIAREGGTRIELIFENPR